MTTFSQAKPAGRPTWIDLSTSDMDGARAFYHALFGWDYDIGGPEFAGYTTARVGQRMAAGIGGNVGSEGAVFPVAWGLYFASHDIEADVARAVEMGATVLFPAMTVGDFGRMAGCVDPGGAVFSFWQAGQHIGAEVIDEPGSAAWFELYAADAKQSRDFYSALLGAPSRQCPATWNTTSSGMAMSSSAASCRSILPGARCPPTGPSTSRWPMQTRRSMWPSATAARC